MFCFKDKNEQIIQSYFECIYIMLNSILPIWVHIYFNDIKSEIYLCETKNNNNNINAKIISSKKKKKKKFDGSPRTVHKKQIMMQINSDRRALVNINKILVNKKRTFSPLRHRVL